MHKAHLQLQRITTPHAEARHGFSSAASNSAIDEAFCSFLIATPVPNFSAVPFENVHSKHEPDYKRASAAHTLQYLYRRREVHFTQPWLESRAMAGNCARAERHKVANVKRQRIIKMSGSIPHPVPQRCILARRWSTCHTAVPDR